MSDTGVHSRGCGCVIGVYTVGSMGVCRGVHSRGCGCVIGVYKVGSVGV